MCWRGRGSSHRPPLSRGPAVGIGEYFLHGPDFKRKLIGETCLPDHHQMTCYKVSPHSLHCKMVQFHNGHKPTYNRSLTLGVRFAKTVPS